MSTEKRSEEKSAWVYKLYFSQKRGKWRARMTLNGKTVDRWFTEKRDAERQIDEWSNPTGSRTGSRTGSTGSATGSEFKRPAFSLLNPTGSTGSGTGSGTGSEFKPLGDEHIKETLVLTLLAWHADNGKQMIPAEAIEDCFCDKQLMLHYFDKAHISETAQNKGILNGVRRHRNSKDLVRYGDFLKAKED